MQKRKNLQGQQLRKARGHEILYNKFRSNMLWPNSKLTTAITPFGESNFPKAYFFLNLKCQQHEPTRPKLIRKLVVWNLKEMFLNPVPSSACMVCPGQLLILIT